jgi:nucleotide-binding universal stress UspA family protein
VEENFVTLAIHTYRKAGILKSFLESEGIGVYLHNISPLYPVVSAGVRVRIKESDLPKALRLIEGSEFDKDINPAIGKPHEKRILIPVDFSGYSIHACEIGFDYAKNTGMPIDILHAFFSPLPEETPFLGEAFIYQDKNEGTTLLAKKAREDLDKFELLIKGKIERKEWPDAPFRCIFKTGLPEEEIVNYSNEIHPELIIMGTRGKTQKETDLIGSVTAEVIETVKTPLLTIPEKTPFRRLSEVKKIAFGTNFGQKDLIAFDNLFKLLSPYQIEYFIFHLTDRPNVWNEIKLAGIKDYFSRQYPGIPIQYRIIDAKNYFVLPFGRFVKKETIDIISLTTYRTTLFSRLFGSGIARKMLFHADTPLFTLHG